VGCGGGHSVGRIKVTALHPPFLRNDPMPISWITTSPETCDHPKLVRFGAHSVREAPAKELLVDSSELKKHAGEVVCDTAGS
jgi:hypothetical protein